MRKTERVHDQFGEECFEPGVITYKTVLIDALDCPVDNRSDIVGMDEKAIIFRSRESVLQPRTRVGE